MALLGGGERTSFLSLMLNLVLYAAVAATDLEERLPEFERMLDVIFAQSKPATLIDNHFCTVMALGMDDTRLQLLMERASLSVISPAALQSSSAVTTPHTCLKIVAYITPPVGNATLIDKESLATLKNTDLLSSHNATVIAVTDTNSVTIEQIRDVGIPVPTYFVHPQKEQSYGLLPLCPNALSPVMASQYCPNVLTGRKLTVSVIGLPPYVIRSRRGIEGGTDMDVLGILASKMGFSYAIKMEKSFGFSRDANKLEGRAASVFNRNATFGLGHPLLLWNYYQLMDYLTPMYPLYPILMTRKPLPISPLFNLVSPFSASVWLAYIAVIVMASGAAVFLIGQSRRFDDSTKGPDAPVLGIYGNTLGQAVKLPGSLKLHLSVFFTLWLAYCFFTKEIFECNLRGYLVKTDYTDLIDGPKDLLESGQKLYMLVGSPFIRLYKGSAYYYERELVKTVGPDQHYRYDRYGRIPVEVEKKLIEEGGAVISAEKMGQFNYPLHIRRHGRPPFRTSKQGFGSMYCSFLVSKSSRVWQEDVNAVIHLLQSAGIVQHLTDKHIQDKYKTGLSDMSTREEGDMAALGLKHFFLGFLALAIGLSLASLATLAEVRSSSRTPQNN